jgi:hypothetical protein
MLLDFLLEAHAWASARPKHDTQVSADRLKAQVQEVMDTEKEQGMSPCPSSYSPLAGMPCYFYYLIISTRVVAVFVADTLLW